MKKITLLIASLTLIANTYSQNVNYKILQNDPQNFYPKLNLNLMLGGIEMGIKNIDGTSIYTGAHGFYMLNDRMGAQASFCFPLLTLGRLGFADYPSAKSFEAGGLLFLSKNSKMKKIKVILKMERGTNTDGREVQTTTYIMVPGTQEVELGFRGGFYSKTGPFGLRQQKITQLEAAGIQNTSLTSVGLYAGVVRRTLNNMLISTDNFGKCMNSLGSDIYADLMIIPYNNFTLLKSPDSYSTGSFKKGDNATDEINKYIKSSPLGFRIGWTGYQIAPKSVTGKRFGMSFNFEGGLMPYQGWFVKGGISITIVKKTSGGDTAPKN
jgi:hypothetical protein